MYKNKPIINGVIMIYILLISLTENKVTLALFYHTITIWLTIIQTSCRVL